MDYAELKKKYSKIIELDEKRIGELETKKIYIEKELELLKQEVADLSGIMIKETFKGRYKCL